LIGPHYALLRPEFAARREESLARRREGHLERILVSMGGVDRDNVTGLVLEALAGMELPEGLRIDAVVGLTAPHFEDVRAQAETMPVPTRILRGVTDMSALMAQSDLAIGAAGTTSWERCCLGLPTVLVTTAANQSEGAAALEQAGAAIAAGEACAPALIFRLRDAVTMLFAPDRLAEVAAKAAGVVDGAGAGRVCDVVASRAYEVRDALVADAEKIYAWRYSGTSAAYYRNSAVPEYDDHVAWIEKSVEDAERRLLMVVWKGKDIGHVRFDLARTEPGVELVSICISPEARGQGHAARVLRAAMLHATGLGAKIFIAKVHPDNAASCRLFERLGFREAGSDEGFRQYAISSDAILDGG
jgi:RimJ/RimL family protein N-acetyltransferase